MGPSPGLHGSLQNQQIEYFWGQGGWGLLHGSVCSSIYWTRYISVMYMSICLSHGPELSPNPEVYAHHGPACTGPGIFRVLYMNMSNYV